MSDQIELECRGRGRPSRKEEERTKRRRRENHGVRRDPLAVVGEKDPNYVYRWINDNNHGRVHSMTVEDDWDVVSTEEMGSKDKGTGTVLERPVDRQGMKAILVKKRKDWYDHDKREEQGQVDELEEQLKHADHGADGLGTGEGYVPVGGISIGQR